METACFVAFWLIWPPILLQQSSPAIQQASSTVCSPAVQQSSSWKQEPTLYIAKQEKQELVFWGKVCEYIVEHEGCSFVAVCSGNLLMFGWRCREATRKVVQVRVQNMWSKSLKGYHADKLWCPLGAWSSYVLDAFHYAVGISWAVACYSTSWTCTESNVNFLIGAGWRDGIGSERSEPRKIQGSDGIVHLVGRVY